MFAWIRKRRTEADLQHRFDELVSEAKTAAQTIESLRSLLARTRKRYDEREAELKNVVAKLSVVIDAIRQQVGIDVAELVTKAAAAPMADQPHHAT